MPPRDTRSDEVTLQRDVVPQLLTVWTIKKRWLWDSNWRLQRRQLVFGGKLWSLSWVPNCPLTASQSINEALGRFPENQTICRQGTRALDCRTCSHAERMEKSPDAVGSQCILSGVPQGVKGS